MEFEQIINQLEWLDKQQRENRDALTTLDGRLASLETTINAVSKQIKTPNKKTTEITSPAKRLEQFESMSTRQRKDFLNIIEEKEKAHTHTQHENTIRLKTELNDL